MKRCYAPYPLALGLLLGGCAVYVPTVPSTPLLTKNQVELTAGLRGISSLELDAAWAPTAHLLLAAESASQSSTTETTSSSLTNTYHEYHRQAGLGLGYYQAPSARSAWYLAAVGGVGFARTELYGIDIFPLPSKSGVYEARYFRYYGQAYAAHPLGALFTGGASVRGTVVDYQRLTYEGQPLVPTNRFFIEPTLFVRVGHGMLQGEGTLGWSLPTGGDTNKAYNARTAPASTLISVGLVFRPDLLKHGGQ